MIKRGGGWRKKGRRKKKQKKQKLIHSINMILEVRNHQKQKQEDSREQKQESFTIMTLSEISRSRPPP